MLAAAQLVFFANMNMLAPIIPLYIMELGVREPGRVQLWVGIVVAANWSVAAIGAPFWGGLADRYGKKPMMLRSLLGLAVVVGSFSLVRSVWQLLGARLVQGTMIGFGTAATALVASQAPRAEVGFAAGMMQTAQVAGTVIGPLVGGTLSHLLGAIRPIFLIMSGSGLLLGLLILLTIREERPQPAGARDPGAAAQATAWSLLRQNPTLRAMLLITVATVFSTQTVDPVLPLYVRGLGVELSAVPLVSGLILSGTGIANVLAAPILGRLGDRLGGRRVLATALTGAAASYGLQFLAPTPWTLLACRFLLGICLGGILPSVNGTISRSLPAAAQGRGFGLAMSASYLGSVLGPLSGGVLSAYVGQRAVFPVSAAILITAGAWVWFGPPAPKGAETT